jgi:hypothetical protein
MENNRQPAAHPDKPRKLNDLIDDTITRILAAPDVTASPSMVTKTLKPLVNGLCLGATTAGFGECPAERVAAAGELYHRSLGMTRAEIVEALVVSKTDGIVPAAQPDLYRRASRVIDGLRPLASAVLREAELIALSTRKVLPADRHGRQHSTIRDTAATHARGRLVASLADRGSWPTIGLDEPARILGTESGRPLTDAQVNPEPKHPCQGPDFSNVDVAALAARGLSVAIRLVGNRHDAEEIAQDAWVRACMYSTGDINASYLATTTRRVAIDKARGTSQELLAPGDDIVELHDAPTDGSQGDELLIWSLYGAIRAAAGCDDRCRRRGSRVQHDATHVVAHAAAEVAVAATPLLLVAAEESTRASKSRSRTTLVDVIRDQASRYEPEQRGAIEKKAIELLTKSALKVAA